MFFLSLFFSLLWNLYMELGVLHKQTQARPWVAQPLLAILIVPLALRRTNRWTFSGSWSYSCTFLPFYLAGRHPDSEYAIWYSFGPLAGLDPHLWFKNQILTIVEASWAVTRNVQALFCPILLGWAMQKEVKNSSVHVWTSILLLGMLFWRARSRAEDGQGLEQRYSWGSGYQIQTGTE